MVWVQVDIIKCDDFIQAMSFLSFIASLVFYWLICFLHVLLLSSIYEGFWSSASCWSQSCPVESGRGHNWGWAWNVSLDRPVSHLIHRKSISDVQRTCFLLSAKLSLKSPKLSILSQLCLSNPFLFSFPDWQRDTDRNVAFWLQRHPLRWPPSGPFIIPDGS